MKKTVFSILVVLIMAVVLTCVFVACDKNDTQDSDYKVTIHLNNGQPDIVWDTTTDIPSITNEGYLLVGFYLDESFTKITSLESLKTSDLTQNIDVYAKWEKYSEGLQYTLNTDENGYAVNGMGTCTDANIIIPVFQGIRTEFGTRENSKNSTRRKTII